MKLLLAFVFLLIAQSDGSAELSELRAREKSLSKQESSGEITNEELRRKVQLLLEDFERWTKANGAKPEIRSRTFTAKELDAADPLTVDRCSPFFDTNREELCLLDLKRSELWGGTVLFCRYFCE